MGKTLVAYATKGGATKATALEVAEVLKSKGFEVQLVDLRKNKNPDITGYSSIVVGAGVRTGRIYGEFYRFLENDLSGKNLAFFLSAYEGVKPKNRERDFQKYIGGTLAKYPNLKPVATEIFGGIYNLFGKIIAGNRDPKRVRAWAEELASKL